MMGIQTLIDNKDAIPQMLRQAGYLTMANQVEDDLMGLAEALTKLEHQHDDALLALRAVIGVIEGEHVFRPDLVTRNEGHILTIAKKALEAQTDG